MALRLMNRSQYAGLSGSTDWWSWTAFIDGPEDELDDVAYVEYHLHPSFPDPVRRVYDREGGFALETKGWGTFELVAKVAFKDTSKKSVLLKHNVRFDRDVTSR